jgi:hypothetical protein
MFAFSSLKELINTIYKEQKLLSEMFEKRKIPYKKEYALEVAKYGEESIEFLINRSVLRQNGIYLEIDDQFLQFFEMILEVNEEINTSFINENIQQIRQNINYWLQENSETRKYSYLKTIKSGLRKTGRVILRNIVDLNRNIDNTFKTEPNYKIKIAKLENYDKKRQDIKQLLAQTEKLIKEDEHTFFKSALDEELKRITTELRLQLNEYWHNLIEIENQIIEFLSQIKYQSLVLEKLRQVKYLKDQFELKNKSNIEALLSSSNDVVFEPKPSYPLKLSLDILQSDEARDIILKVAAKVKTGVKPVLPVAERISEDYLETAEEKEIIVNLEEVKNSFTASGNNLFDFILNYEYPKELDFEEKVTVYCQMISLYEKEFEITDNYQKLEQIEFALVYPK